MVSRRCRPRRDDAHRSHAVVEVRKHARGLHHPSAFRSHGRSAGCLHHIVAVWTQSEAVAALRSFGNQAARRSDDAILRVRHSHPPRSRGTSSRDRRDDRHAHRARRRGVRRRRGSGDGVQGRAPAGRAGVRISIRLRRALDRHLRGHAAERKSPSLRQGRGRSGDRVVSARIFRTGGHTRGRRETRRLSHQR